MVDSIAPRPVRVCFLVPELTPSGGVAVALGHAARLADRPEFEVDVVVTDGVPHGTAVALEDACTHSYDVAIATWWRTAEATWQLDAARRVLLLQGPDDRHYRQDETLQRLAAELPLRMPFDLIAVSSWLGQLAEAARPGASCRVVPTGIDKETFKATRRPSPANTFRVLVEGQPSLWFKGVRDALEAVRAMQHDATVTLVALDPDSADGIEADRVVGGLGPQEMAALYAEHDVLLKLSRFEGFGLAPLEAFHVGIPCVVTPYGGHVDYVEHGKNGLIVGFDDIPATTRWLDRLASDRALLKRLAAGAVQTAARWPDPSESTDLFAEALEESVRSPPPDTSSAIAAMACLVRAEAELGHAQVRHLAGSLAWNEAEVVHQRRELERLNDLVVELFRSRDECAEMLERERATVAEIKNSRAYRAGVALRRLKPGR